MVFIGFYIKTKYHRTIIYIYITNKNLRFSFVFHIKYINITTKQHEIIEKPMVFIGFNIKPKYHRTIYIYN